MAAGPAMVGAALRTALVWGWFVVAVGAVSLVAYPLAVQSAEGSYCENIDHPGPCAGPAELFVLPLTILAVGAATLVPARAWRRGRPWGRWGVAVVFALWAVGGLVGARAVLDSNMGLHVGALVFWLGVAGAFGAVAALALRSSPHGGELAMGPDQGRS